MNQEDMMKPSPGLNMEHGFVRKIEQNQHLREQQAKEDASKRMETSKLARRVGMPSKSAKPTMEIYRPPSLRMSGEFTNYPVSKSYTMPSSTVPMASAAPQMVASALPFVNSNGTHIVPTVVNDENTQIQTKPVVNFQTSNMVGVAVTSSVATVNANTMHTSKVHFQLQVPTHQVLLPVTTGKIPSTFGLKRSKSLGAGDMKLAVPSEYDIGGYGLEIQTVIRKSLEDPNKLSPRQLMELVRHIFNRVLDNSRYAEPAAKLCCNIIEKEKTETFLESLLNSCREWYNERDRLLRPFPSGNGSSSNHRWVAYVTFLYEMYAQMKTRQRSRGSSSGSIATASPMLLSLLCECCHVFLKPPSLKNLSEIECLFFVLTSIGRDLENEFPQRLHQLISAVRDAFINPSIPPFISKTLLQLIELHASKWQLTAPAVMYYYPGSQERK